MLDTDTKRRIDTARDILVGKVPDPKSQVEQITIALIYKFMDDMDVQSEEMGGKRKFFANGFSRYGWAKLMRSGLGGHEVLNLYAEALAKMPQNPGIPPLFRDIFKNAYLPYRDPETLKSFLKIIGEFNYDHSERLGDAFEYLLSVLGSQGDAGQFRTPRHIIDFIVEIVGPKKNETILDPACGTAGFLISAYKHILRANPGAKGGPALTPDDKGRLARNLKGYDISPDMVRLSLVNLYLHGFNSPKIDEYDTLTSEDKWNETADVIFANPPFMSPKGGIKPHRRFGVQSKRSEVLFVDYIAEHLTPAGRAGIIVPEGIIFQSQASYTALRKMLVTNHLVAVISLPAGVFNPYSGVKTSVLILDRSLARKSNTIAFFKVENDGFGLGAQRRAMLGSELAQVKTELGAYLQAVRNGQPVDELQPMLGLIVEKTKIAANGDYNLSAERYRESKSRASNYKSVQLGEICDLIGGATPSKENKSYWSNGSVKWISSKHIDQRGQITGYELISEKAVAETSTRITPKGSTIIITRVSVGKFAFADDNYAINQDLTGLVSRDPRRLDPEFIRVMALHIATVVERNAEGIGVRGVTRKFLSELEIPVPPLEVQKEIAAEIEGYQKVINGARAVLDNYRPHIPIHPDWPTTELGEVCVIRSGGTPDRSNKVFWGGEIPWISTTLIDYGVIGHAQEFITPEGLSNSSAWIVPKGTVIMAMYGQGVTRGRVAVLGIDAAVNQACATFRITNESLLPSYLFEVLRSRYEDLRRISEARGGNQSNLSAQLLKQYRIPFPPLLIQQEIVAEIEAEQALVAANRDLISRFEQKIQATIARVWGENDA